MRKKVLALIVVVILLIASFSNVQAEESQDTIVQMTNCPESVFVGEVFNIEVNIKNVKSDYNCSARWVCNDKIIDGYKNDNYLVKNNKKSQLTFKVPLGTKPGSILKIGYELVDGNKIYKAERDIKVSSQVNHFDVQFTYVTQQVYKGELIEIYAQVKNPIEGKDFTVPVAWQKNGITVEGYQSDSFQISNSRDSVIRFYAPDKTATMTISFVINPNNLPGVEKTSATAEINVIDYPPEYYAKINKDRILSTIKPVEVDATVIRDTSIYSDMNLRNKIGSLASGTQGKYINYNGKTAAKLYLSDGTCGWVPYKNIQISNKDYTVYDDFSNEDKELFADIEEYASDTPYLIWINLERQKVNVFIGEKGNWKIEKVMPCASGRNETPTIAGVFKYSQLLAKWDFGQYVVRPVMVFNGGHAMHSRTYKPDGSLLDSTMGKPASHGCVRMLQEDIDWLAYFIPIGTTVVVY